MFSHDFPFYFISFISRVALILIITTEWLEVPVLAARATAFFVLCGTIRSTNLEITREGARQNNLVFSRITLLIILLIPQLVLSQIFKDVFIYLLFNLIVYFILQWLVYSSMRVADYFNCHVGEQGAPPI